MKKYTLKDFLDIKSDPDGDVTEVIECDPVDYKKYFDWQSIGDRIMERAVEMRGK